MNNPRIFIPGLVLVLCSAAIIGRATRQNEMKQDTVSNHVVVNGVMLPDPTVEPDTVRIEVVDGVTWYIIGYRIASRDPAIEPDTIQ